MYLNVGISVFRRRIQVAAVRSTKVQTRTSSHGDDLPGQQWAGRQRVNRGGEVSSNHGNHIQKTGNSEVILCGWLLLTKLILINNFFLKIYAVIARKNWILFYKLLIKVKSSMKVFYVCKTITEQPVEYFPQTSFAWHFCIKKLLL